MNKYFCKWGFINTKTVDDKFFVDGDKYPEHMTFKKNVGYSPQDMFMILMLDIGDTLDLSDDFQEHTITKVE
jgi:ABC-type multidrug transport system ATPase subunit